MWSIWYVALRREEQTPHRHPLEAATLFFCDSVSVRRMVVVALPKMETYESDARSRPLRRVEEDVEGAKVSYRDSVPHEKSVGVPDVAEVVEYLPLLPDVQVHHLAVLDDVRLPKSILPEVVHCSSSPTSVSNDSR